jgi:quinoprotein dehydrogenase-associated probable ABC transporter substrate-binding protein
MNHRWGKRWALCLAAVAAVASLRWSEVAAEEAGAGKHVESCGAITTVKTGSAEHAPANEKHRVLKVAADPNNLPFTNSRLDGFENKVAAILAREMNADLQYQWHAQRRGFFRETITQGDCDLALGAPQGFERALPTRPYYRSTYMFVTRRDRHLKLGSLDDPRLRTLKIGVQVIGDDGVNTPPAHALAARGIIDNITGYSVYGDYSKPNPTAGIIEAVARGEVNVAFAWGPLAGYFAPEQSNELELTPVTPAKDERSQMQFTFDIGVGVRKGNTKLRDEVNEILVRCRDEINGILDDYHVPRLPLDDPPQTARQP